MIIDSLLNRALAGDYDDDPAKCSNEQLSGADPRIR